VARIVGVRPAGPVAMSSSRRYLVPRAEWGRRAGGPLWPATVMNRGLGSTRSRPGPSNDVHGILGRGLENVDLRMVGLSRVSHGSMYLALSLGPTASHAAFNSFARHAADVPRLSAHTARGHARSSGPADKHLTNDLEASSDDLGTGL
jgi:hypothetical protein